MTLDENLEQLDGLDRAATIVVWSIEHRDELRRRIVEQLGAEMASQITICIVPSASYAMAHLAGRRPPVFVDARWYRQADRDLINMVDAYARASNSRPREAKLERTTRFE